MGRYRRVKPPTVVELSYQKISICFFPESDTTDDLGTYLANEYKILIRSKLRWEEEANTLLHELFHAIFFCYNIREKSDEETIVTKLANGYNEIMIRNPKLRDYFRKVWGQCP